MLQNPRRNIIPILLDEKINPEPYKKRRAPKIEVNQKYYVSFGEQKVYKGVVQRILPDTTVHFGILTEDGDVCQVNKLFAIELGETPEQACLNEVFDRALMASAWSTGKSGPTR